MCPSISVILIIVFSEAVASQKTEYIIRKIFYIGQDSFLLLSFGKNSMTSY
jgi:hypothetical protein